MCFGKKRMKSFVRLQVLLSVLFVVQLAMSPLAYSKLISPEDRTAGGPLSRYQEVYIINDVALNEVLNIINLNRIISKNSKDVQRLVSRFQEVWMAPVVLLGILLIYTATHFQVLRQRKPILATSLGGHAPPAELISHI
jgi:hypothetical protein